MSVDIAEFEKTFVYQRTATILEVTADLQTIGQFDAYHERQKSIWGYAIAACVLTGIGSFMMLSMTNTLPQYPAISFCWLGLCFCAFIVCIVKRLKHGASDLTNRRYELLEEVLRLLEKDSPSNEPVEVRIDLQKPNHATKRVREGKVGPWNVEYFVDPWLELSGRFLDGTSFCLQGLEKYQDRRKKYRSRSGKSKTKSKSKSALQVTVSLKPSPKRYAESDVISTKLEGALQLPKWSRQKFAGVHKDRLLLTTLTAVDWHGKPLPPNPDEDTYASGPHLVAMMFLSLYQALNQSQIKPK
ncbi:MAG: hypothetical protein NT013_29480 [Planctomycetia bacterium]|nr:hypothetical protein [Planctomycetia bacterium]